ncbi:MAG TPA: FkbM family methyltransferase, partial [Candidatus Binataceae bacterium]|nr:FkbM family methyltransferase [Candidatus Binataceae bacterium]
LGWSGINIEPVPRWFDLLVADRPRDINLRLAAGASAGEVIFHEFLDTGLSTAIDRHAERHERNGFQRRTYAVPVRPLRDICAEHVRGEIHFLKIDVEGAEREVLQGCDFARYRPWIVVIEATEPLLPAVASYADWEDILLDAGYEFVADDIVNRYYLSREHQELKRALPIGITAQMHRAG